MAPGPLHVAPRPCPTCPYARSTPPGIWHPDEYAKLARYDAMPLSAEDLATFHCHQQNVTGRPTVCRGWLGVHADSPAVRLAVTFGRLSAEVVPFEQDPGLYSSGAEACAAGMAGVDAPDSDAQDAMGKLLRRGAGRLS